MIKIKLPDFGERVRLIAWNLSTLVCCLVCPSVWSVPFGVALLSAAGTSSLRFEYFLPGALLGCLLGDGGIGGFLGCAIALVLARIIARGRNSDALCAACAGICAFVPSILINAHKGFFYIAVTVLSALLAFVASPVLKPAMREDMFTTENRTRDERIALHFLLALCVAGISYVRSEAGMFVAGLYALIMSFGGVRMGALGAFSAGAGLLIGGLGAREAGLLLLCAGAAGAVRAIGTWAQALAFLVGLPLSIHMGRESGDILMLAAAVIYPLIPVRLLTPILNALSPRGARESAPYRVDASRRHAPVKGERVCGDCGAIEKMPNDRVLLLLADGMGAGSEARSISERCVSVAKKMIRADLDDATAYAAINKLSCVEPEAYSTLDACVVDLRTGDARFHKCGSEPAWIVRRSGFTRVEGESLPLGVLGEAPPTRARARLSPGDCVFMATDGLTNALGGATAAEALLNEYKALPPSEICSKMLKTAETRGMSRRADDMSALCARLVLRSR